MRTAGIVVLERHQLSDGWCRVARLGRRYSFDRTFADGRCPETHPGIPKDEAYRLMGDALRRDVLELD